MRLLSMPAVLWFAVVSARATVLANDTMAGGSGSDLVPLSTDRVRMVAEDILIRDVGGKRDPRTGSPIATYWQVEAGYTFENLSAEPIDAQLGFPEYACEHVEPGEEPMCDPKPLRFESMHTLVNDKPVEHRRGTIRKGHPWRPRLGQVWLYDVRFAPKQLTRISHRYRVAQGVISDGTAIGHYVTRTGATWAGRIGHARFRIHVPAQSRDAFVDMADPTLAVTLHVVEVNGVKTGEMLLEARDWEPARDLSFGFNAMRGMRLIDVSPSSDSPPPPQAARCPKAVELWERGRALAELNDSASPAEPSELDVARFAREGIGDPRICRNFVFAVYGRRFEDDALNRHFYGDGGFVPGSWPYAPFEPNPDFSEAALTVGDWNTLRLIDAVERRLAQAAPSSAAPSSPAPSRPALVAAPPADAPPRAPPTPRARGCGIVKLTPNAAPGDLLLPCFALSFAAVRAAKRAGRRGCAARSAYRPGRGARRV